jgi:hypothetical protein
MNKLYTILMFMSFLSCGKKIQSHPGNFKGNVITYGNGGGFTGAVSAIYLQEDGHIFRNGLSDTSYIHVGKLTKDQTTQFFKNYQSLGLDKMKLDQPGNRYYFLEFKNSKNVQKIQWGGKELENNNPKVYYKLMMDLIKKIESSEK